MSESRTVTKQDDENSENDKKEDKPLHQASLKGIFSQSTKPLTEEEVLAIWKSKSKSGKLPDSCLNAILNGFRNGVLSKVQLESFSVGDFYNASLFLSSSAITAIKENFTTLPKLMELGMFRLIEVETHLFTDMGLKALRKKIVTLDDFIYVGSATPRDSNFWSKPREILGGLLRYEAGQEMLSSKKVTIEMLKTGPLYEWESIIESLRPRKKNRLDYLL